jgi:putative colanic acid biosynthesis acetyltransferase WcaF
MKRHNQPLGQLKSEHGWSNKIVRLLWGIVWTFLFAPTPRYMLNGWRCLLLRIFGADLGVGCEVYPTCRIWAPWNLTMGDYSVLSDNVDCYCVEKITLGPHSRVSQYSFLCAAGHDYESMPMPLTKAPIKIGAYVWICADVYVGMGVEIGDGAVVGARSSVLRSIQPWVVVAGSPARIVNQRKFRPNQKEQP